MNRDCIVDTGRGAICKDVNETKPKDPTSPCGNDVSLAGFCDGDTYVFCDKETKQAKAWQCDTEGLKCGDKTCKPDGAYCCTPDGKLPEQPPGDACMGLDFAGECNGEKARWCANGAVQEMDCAASGKRCEKDTCASGAFCCGGPANSCEEIGIFGVCNGNAVRYCLDGNIQQYECGAGTTCQEQTCFPGAECCAPPAAGDACAQLGYRGECQGNTLRYCNGQNVVTADCAETGDVCMVDACLPGQAACCPASGPTYDCSQIGFDGICDGDKLVYCTGSEVNEYQCTGGQVCKPTGCFGAPYANCCAP
jgi:hypothetical protein